MAGNPHDTVNQLLLGSSDKEDGLVHLASPEEEDVSNPQQTRPPAPVHPTAAIPLQRQPPIPPQLQPQLQLLPHVSMAGDLAHSTANAFDGPVLKGPVALQHVAAILDQRRVLYAQKRDHFSTVLNNILFAIKKDFGEERMEELRKLSVELLGTSESLKVDERQIRELEYEVFGSNFPLSKSEGVSNVSESSPALSLPASNHAAVPLSGQNWSPPAQALPEPLPLPASEPPTSLTTLSTPTELREARQQVEFLEQQLGDLDYDHLKDIDFRRLALDEGERLDPPDDQFYRTYESIRTGLMLEMAQAEKRVYGLEEELKQPPAERLKEPAPRIPQKQPQYCSNTHEQLQTKKLSLPGDPDDPAKSPTLERPNLNSSPSLYSRVQTWLASIKSG